MLKMYKPRYDAPYTFTAQVGKRLMLNNINSMAVHKITAGLHQFTQTIQGSHVINQANILDG